MDIYLHSTPGCSFVGMYQQGYHRDRGRDTLKLWSQSVNLSVLVRHIGCKHMKTFAVGFLLIPERKRPSSSLSEAERGARLG